MSESPCETFFNAHHSPAGAFSSLTLGAKGACGGFGVELGGPANEDVFIGLESGEKPGKYLALPFFSGAALGSDSREFDVESLSGIGREPKLSAFPDAEVSRNLGPCIDEWRAGDLCVRIISPAGPLPDPDQASAEDMKLALVPAILVEITVDNRSQSRVRKAFFGWAGSSRSQAMRPWSTNGLVGASQGPVSIGSIEPNAYAGAAFQPEAVLEPSHESNLGFMLGRVGLVVATVPPGKVCTLRFAAAFFREGTATSGLRSKYLYRKYFASEEEVLRFALESFEALVARAEQFDLTLAALPPERRLMLAHAIRSYYGSTQCLELEDGGIAWIVNEGEYRMMNTLDLTVDQAFFELEMNPWTVRNQLDLHRERGMYRDSMGVAFTHDLGVANAFAEPGRSAYEQAGLTGCFSYMSCEELLNWTITACMYGLHAGDRDWLFENMSLFEECFQSMCCRDNPDPGRRTGVMSFDGDRCEGGREITTYDSLDASLGQASGSLYLAVKSWAAYVLLGEVFDRLARCEPARQARSQAGLCADTIASSADDTGILPAILGTAVPARIIPAIEGLAFPLFLGLESALTPNGPYASLIGALDRHLRAVFDSGECQFPDGGWRLSSTSSNSWLSKIYLCQYVAECQFGLPRDTHADRAHLSWLMRPDNAYFAWSDQMLDGLAVGSRYYPRGVTGWLWLANKNALFADERGGSRLSEAR